MPTVADLRARRLELTRAALRESILAGELDTFRVVVESLAEEFDLMDIAAAAVKLAHEASHDEEGGAPTSRTSPFPHVPERQSRGPQPWRDRGRRAQAARGKERGQPRGRERGPERRAEGGRGERSWDRVRLFIGTGRAGGLRPGDLVGAIANEAGVPGSAIGAIEIADDFSLVEVPADAADHMIERLRRTKIRGKRVMVRRDGGDSGMRIGTMLSMPGDPARLREPWRAQSPRRAPASPRAGCHRSTPSTR